MPKFDCIQNHIIRFIREYRIPRVENRKYSIEIHDMVIGDDAYVYDGKLFGFKSVFCSGLECFLNNLEKSAVNKFVESVKKKK